MAERFSSESKEEMWKTSRAQILVVDDDAVSRKILAQLLASAGYECRECEDGTEALELMRAKQPSLLLLDFDMPGLDGAEVLKSRRSDSDPAIAQIPVIMLTGHGSEESEVRCLQAGADDFVTKPVNAAVLRARIETQLRLRSMRRQLPPCDPSGRRYLWLAAHERWPDLVLDCRWYRPRRRRCAAYHAGETSFSSWQRRARQSRKGNGSSE